MLQARWTIDDGPEGRHVVYSDSSRGVYFDCGVCPAETLTPTILEFILSEGDPGDLVFLNGTFLSQNPNEAQA